MDKHFYEYNFWAEGRWRVKRAVKQKHQHPGIAAESSASIPEKLYAYELWIIK